MREVAAAGFVSFLASSASIARADDLSTCIDSAEHAQDSMAASQLKKAREELLVCVREVCPKQVKTDCEGWLADVERDQPSIVVVATGADGTDRLDAHVTIEGVEVASRLDGTGINLDPGPVKLHVESDAGKADVEVLVLKGEKNRVVRVKLVPEKPMPEVQGPSYVGPVAVISVGVAALGVFAALEGVAQSEYADLEDGCGFHRQCREEDVAGTRTKFQVAGVALTTGLVAVTAGATWAVVIATKKRTGAGDIALRIAPSYASLAVRF